MKSAKKLREEFNKKLRTLQDNCQHQVTQVMPYEWAPGHYGGDVEVCLFCEKIVK
jgi:hypothetical protein